MRVSTAPPLGCIFEVKSSKIPCIPPPLPVQGVVGHTIDRCIIFVGTTPYHVMLIVRMCFVISVFVAAINYENIFTTTVSKFTVLGVVDRHGWSKGTIYNFHSLSQGLRSKGLSLFVIPTSWYTGCLLIKTPRSWDLAIFVWTTSINTNCFTFVHAHRETIAIHGFNYYWCPWHCDYHGILSKWPSPMYQFEGANETTAISKCPSWKRIMSYKVMFLMLIPS